MQKRDKAVKEGRKKKAQEMKTYVLTLSQVFPVTHKRAGEPTNFREVFLMGQKTGVWNDIPPHFFETECRVEYPKYHTIRAAYDLWARRFEEIEAGEACLSIRQWTGKPYRSKQVEIARLTREDGIGIQKLDFPYGTFSTAIIDGGKAKFYDVCTAFYGLEVIAHNDGLSLDDWKDWFKGYDLSKSMAIIHFTKFRY